MAVSGAPVLGGRYQLGDLLGSGGMADVRRATDLLLGRDVAVKLLRAPSDAEAAVARFRDEARTLAALSDPHLVTVWDVSPPEVSPPYLVMDLIDGPSLAQRLAAEGALAEPDLRRLGAQLGRGLATAHACGVIHRDVKPGNILFRPDGSAVLTDFGIARLEADTGHATRTGHVIGSPAYLAPEQVRGLPLTSAVDVYALGLVLLECATGLRAFPGPGLEAALARLTTSPALPVSLPSDLRRLLARMTDADPAARPTAREVAETLEPVSVGAQPARPAMVSAAVLDVATEEVDLRTQPFAAPGRPAVRTSVLTRPRPVAVTALAAVVVIAALGALGPSLQGSAVRPELILSPVTSESSEPVAEVSSPAPSPVTNGSDDAAGSGGGEPGRSKPDPGRTAKPDGGKGAPSKPTGKGPGSGKKQGRGGS